MILALLLACRDEPVVAVVGGGPAGLAAAIEAARGAHVVLVEARSELGGSATLGDAVTALPTESVLAELDAAAGHPNPARTRMVLRVQADVVDWLATLGVVWRPVPHHADVGTPLVAPEGGGSRLVAALIKAAEAGRVEVRLSSRVERLDRVPRLRVHLAGGATIDADAVVLATGGFAGNLDRVRERLDLGDTPLLRGAASFADGNGIALGTSLGAVEVEPAEVIVYGHGMPAPEDPTRAVMLTDGLHAFPVGADGTYLPELQSPRGDSGTALRQHGGTGWAVIDANAIRGMMVWDVDERRMRSIGPILGAFGVVAPDLDAVAAKLAVPAEVLHGAVAPRAVLASPRQPLLRAAQYGAVPLRLASAKSLTGLRVDLDGRLLDAEGSPIAGLYAAGELAGFAHPWEGRHIDSTMVSGAVLTGRAAGRAAIADLAR